ncbi:hypothetical protein ACHAQJ_009041 [Trichoderma viride]
MAFWDQIGQGLAHAHQEAARHITAENINRAAQAVLSNVDNAAQQINQHVTPENINRAAEEVRRGWDNAARGLAEATENARPHVGRAVVNARDALRDAASHVNAENIATGAGIVHEHVNNVASHVSREIGTASEGAVAWASDEKNIQAVKDGARDVTLKAVNTAQEHPVATLGLLMMVAPGVITAPIRGIFSLIGFTSTGVAAKSIASGAQAAAGNVAAKSAFATAQSAAAGGYGLGFLTGIVRAVGGAIAGVGGIVEGLMWAYEPQHTQSLHEED